MKNEMKRDLSATGAPCGYISLDSNGHERREFPGVDCDNKCATCGWNPREKKRRLETGTWSNEEIVTKDANGEVVLSIKVKQLRFKGYAAQNNE